MYSKNFKSPNPLFSPERLLHVIGLEKNNTSWLQIRFRNNPRTFNPGLEVNSFIHLAIF